MAQNEPFTGKMTITVELDCEETDADLLAANLEAVLDARLESALDVLNYTVQVEKFTS